MNPRRLAAGTAILVALASFTVGCGSSSKSSSSTTTKDSTTSSSPVISGVVAPVVLTAADPTVTVRVGQVVEFSLGDPGQGTYVARSSDGKVFKITNEGKTVGTSAQNAGGVAEAAGTAEVTVAYEGSMNGVGAPTIFTITVTG
jgi:hypothetical protein